MKQVLQEPGNRPIKIWTDHVEDSALTQLKNLAGLPFVHPFLAVMPDVHLGYGATVGSVVPTLGAIIPAAVGVDIGCGMMAVQTTLDAKLLPDSLHARTPTSSTRPRWPTRTSTRSWPLRPTSSTSSTRCARWCASRAERPASDIAPPRALQDPGQPLAEW